MAWTTSCRHKCRCCHLRHTKLLCALCCGDLSFSTVPCTEGNFSRNACLPCAARAFDSALPPLSFLPWMLLLNHPAGQVNASHKHTGSVLKAFHCSYTLGQNSLLTKRTIKPPHKVGEALCDVLCVDYHTCSHAASITAKNGAEIKRSAAFEQQVFPAGQRKQNRLSPHHMENVSSPSVGSPYATLPAPRSLVLSPLLHTLIRLLGREYHG